MSNIDLNTCVPGQLVELRNGNIVRYIKKRSQDTVYSHMAGEYSYTDDGYYYSSREEDDDDVVRIIPLAKPKPPESDTHPSVAWWESCPWITDRKPTEEDGDNLGQVIQQMPWTMVTPCSRGISETTTTLCFMSWAYVKEGRAWIHSLNWGSVKQTPKEKALALIASHEDGWIPTPDQWNIIREGLAE